MKLTINSIKSGGLLAVFALPLAVQAQVYNLNNYDNFANYYYNGDQYTAYVGPGAYPDATSTDFWNGFGVESNGNNPYPGTGLLSDSTGAPSAITYSISYDNNNGALYNYASGSSPNSLQGTPGFLFGQAALVGSDLGTLTFQNVTAGSYDLYLYGANFDGTRGATFTVSSGTAVGGFSATTNPYLNGGSGPLTTFILGGDYVEFTGVMPDANGNINITWTQNPLDNSGGGEGDFNGASLVAAPEPSTLALLGVGVVSLLAAGRRKQLILSK